MKLSVFPVWESVPWRKLHLPAAGDKGIELRLPPASDDVMLAMAIGPSNRKK